MSEDKRPQSDEPLLLLEEYFPAAYQELKKVAHNQLYHEHHNNTFNTTGLVNEAFLKMSAQRKQEFANKSQFFALASNAMRRILIDHARKKKSEKRGGDQFVVTLEDQAVIKEGTYEDMIALDEAIHRYNELSKRGAKIIELWFFGGFKHEEIADILEISTATVRREWRLARLWLSREIRRLSA